MQYRSDSHLVFLDLGRGQKEDTYLKGRCQFKKYPWTSSGKIIFNIFDTIAWDLNAYHAYNLFGLN